MYLKKIEVQGFKSFANKIVFDFHDGITAIVGPNGSGKSNVSDAVRWVLGEQSAKQLRGGNMQDVIFAGTEIRKPQGYAYVAITLDNTDHILPVDFDEIKVSRRLYRSGESEYKINDSICRLKDIQEIFYDTGIGKDGYSIIGQGQVEKILNGKPEERRELFDEAAGITKFKRRKLIASKKLEGEESNLIRISDILQELEKQVGPLKKQSEIAKKYLTLRESLKAYDAYHYIKEFDRIDAILKSFAENVQIYQADLSQAKERGSALDAEYEAVSQESEEIEIRFKAMYEDLARLDLEIQNGASDIRILQGEMSAEDRRKEDISDRIAHIQKDIVSKQELYDALQHKLKELEKQKEDMQQSCLMISKELESKDVTIAELEAVLDQNNRDVLGRMNQRGELLAKSKGLESKLEQIQIRRSEVSAKLLKIKTDFDENHKKKESLGDECRILQEEMASYSKALENLDAQKNDIEKERANISKVLNEKRTEYQNQFARLESLKNIAERYDGYGNSIRKVMETKDRIKGIHGVVADLISTKKEYELAIEIALGGRIQNIVTDSEETAKSLIEYLKKNKYGRATFLPLSSMNQGYDRNFHAALKEKGVLGVAADLVQSDVVYQNLIENLLGKTLIMDTIDHAIALERKYKYAYRVVTLDGEQLSPGGSLSGGAFKNASNLLGRKREIEDLEDGLKALEDRVEYLTKQKEACNQTLVNNRRDYDDMAKKFADMQINLHTLENQKKALNEKQEDIKESLDDLNIEYERLGSDIHGIKAEKQQLTGDISALEDVGHHSKQQIESLQANIVLVKEERTKIFEQSQDILIRLNNLENNLSFVQSDITRSLQEKEALETEQKDNTDKIKDIEELLQNTQSKIAEIQKEIAIYEKDRVLKQETLADIEMIKRNLSVKTKEIFSQRTQIMEDIAGLEKEILKLESGKEKEEESVSRLISYMWNEYELNIANVKAYMEQHRDMVDIANLDKNIRMLKQEIKSLGPVNIAAIHDYTEVAERYELMQTQYEDITKAKEELQEIIKELDAGMRKQFVEKFALIEKEFNTVFKELFGGGSTKLTLDEGEDILEAGIHIISQPPGKKLQNMMQLSGGEKALTAISLLFAIQNLKPSPFALLDEIEAALDDSNVDRFAKYLHKLTKHTQFIVITHRRGTMVSADRLYGITMQEKGISTLVSVNLIENTLSD